MYRDVTPPRVVEVLKGGEWFPGFLDAWRNRKGLWEGYVCYTVGVGRRHVAWLAPERLRCVG